MYDFEMDDLDLEMQGWRWGSLFLRTSSYLLANDRDEILKTAIKMYCSEEDERKIEGTNYEGKIRNTKRIDVFSSFVGIRFEAELDTVYGKDRMEFIINEQTPGRQMHYSPN